MKIVKFKNKDRKKTSGRQLFISRALTSRIKLVPSFTTLRSRLICGFKKNWFSRRRKRRSRMKKKNERWQMIRG